MLATEEGQESLLGSGGCFDACWKLQKQAESSTWKEGVVFPGQDIPSTYEQGASYISEALMRSHGLLSSYSINLTLVWKE